jgi:hypothetical protein
MITTGVVLTAVFIILVAGLATLYLYLYSKSKRTKNKSIIIRTYTNPRIFETDANKLAKEGFVIQDVTGGGKHFSGPRATIGFLLAGPLGLLFSTGKNPIIVTYVRAGNETGPKARTENYCPYCGSKIPAEGHFCPDCGKEIQLHL